MKYYKTAELAEILPLSARSLRRKIKTGEFGETLNVGGMHLVSEDGLRHYISEHTGPAYHGKNKVMQMRRRRHVDCMAKI